MAADHRAGFRGGVVTDGNGSRIQDHAVSRHPPGEDIRLADGFFFLHPGHQVFVARAVVSQVRFIMDELPVADGDKEIAVL